MTEGLLLMLGHYGDGGWSYMCNCSAGRSLVCTMLLAICALFSACSSAAELARLMGGFRGGGGSGWHAGWDRLDEFLQLLCEDVFYPEGFEDHEWLDEYTGRIMTLNVHEAWADLRWLYHMHRLPTRLKRHRGVCRAAEATRADLLASNADVGVVTSSPSFSFSDPVCATILELVCAAKLHSVHVSEVRDASSTSP